LTTGFHGIHVIGGLLAFLFVLGRTYMTRKFTHEQAVSAIAVSYYWHLVDVVWSALFAAIYLIQSPPPLVPGPVPTRPPEQAREPGQGRSSCDVSPRDLPADSSSAPPTACPRVGAAGSPASW